MATPIHPFVQSKQDQPIDTSYAPQYSDVLAATDGEMEAAKMQQLPATNQPMYSPVVPGQPGQRPVHPGWSPPPPPVMGGTDQQFEFEKQRQYPYHGNGQNQMAPRPLEYYSSSRSDIPFYVKYRLPIIAAIVFFAVVAWVQPKLSGMLPAAFVAGRPNTLGISVMAVVAAFGFHVVERTTSTL